jgi:hypothetical protein
MVKITKENYDFWKTYYINTEYFSKRFLNVIYQFKYDLNDETWNKYKDYIGLSNEYFSSLSDTVKNFNKKAKTEAHKYFTNLGGGFTGASSTLHFPSDEEKHIFVAFASTVPLEKIDQKQSSYWSSNELKKSFSIFQKCYKSIVMSVNIIHNPKSPASTHFGIFRNPLDIHESFLKFKGKNPHGNIVMILHGFAAKAAQQYWGKKWLTSCPTLNMLEIFKNTIGKENIHSLEKLEELHKNFSKEWEFSVYTDGRPTIAVPLDKLTTFFIKIEIE